MTRFSGGHRAVLKIAVEAQRQAIRKALCVPCVDGWGDDAYYFSHFRAEDVRIAALAMPDALDRRRWASAATPRKYLNAMVRPGFLTEHRYSTVVRYRFPRARCDALAAEILQEQAP